MEITNDFTISLPPQRAYELLVDLERVAPCMPGAELGDELPDGSRAVKVRVKLGPMKFTYDGTVRIAERDEAAQRAVLVGTAKEARGQGDANATITMQVRPGDAGGSHVVTHAQVDLSGRAAQMGHGVVQAVSKQLMGQMTATLEQRFAQPEAAPDEPAAPRAADHGSASVPIPLKTSPKAARTAPADATRSTPTPAADARPGAPPAPAAGPPVKAGALMLAVVRDWFRRLVRRRPR